LPAIKPLVSEGVRTNATLMFNPTQALMAGLAGSPFISPFIGRARMTGSNGIDAIARMRALYDAWGINNTCIIGASIKDVEQVIEVILAGAHAIAVPFALFEAMMAHPLTENGVAGFMAEFEQVQLRTGE
jgi:transaldolase